MTKQRSLTLTTTESPESTKKVFHCLHLRGFCNENSSMLPQFEHDNYGRSCCDLKTMSCICHIVILT